MSTITLTKRLNTLKILNKEEEEMLGSYSYLNQNDRRFSYTDGNNVVHHFAITTVNNNIAVIQFFNDNTFNNPQGVPAGFGLSDSLGAHVPIFQNSWFITWVDSYELSHNGNIIWRITNQKQQSVRALGGGIQGL